MIASDKFRQIWYDMRHQSVVTWVTLVGTALSVFLLMVVVSLHQLSVMPFAPESNRPRLLYGENIHYRMIVNESPMGGSSYSLDGETARKLYSGLDGVELESIVSCYALACEAEGYNGKSTKAYVRKSDENFWKIYDHRLLSGRYFDKDENDAASKVAVITEHVARELFDKTDPAGETIYLDFLPFKVVGVVADHSKLARQASGDVFIPAGPTPDGVLMALLPGEGVSLEHIKDQVKARYAELDTELAEIGHETVYHETPYKAEIVAKGAYGSNNTPDLDGGRRKRYLTYLILLLLPAINLASMLSSRIRRRIGEFGIRRAFGCTRSKLIRSVISENLIITVTGGIIGWICSMLFLTMY
ncbi:MAG: ABC transporter permease, partial [Muribaculaceae bacterium]|nr:ABC transporter permease [Muribaculaceae bacterium]